MGRGGPRPRGRGAAVVRLFFRLVVSLVLALALILLRPALVNGPGTDSTGAPQSSAGESPPPQQSGTPSAPVSPTPSANATAPASSAPQTSAPPSMSASTAPTTIPTVPGDAPRRETVTVRTIRPVRGPASGGTTIVITGSGLESIRWIWFGDQGPIAVSDPGEDSISVRTPAFDLPPGREQARVNLSWAEQVDGERRTLGAGFTFEVVDVEVSGVKPDSGPLAGGNRIRIVGTGLEQVVAVIFGGGGTAQILDQSDSTIVVKAPRGNRVGEVRITMAGPGGTRLAAAPYTYLRPREQGTSEAGPPGDDDRVEVTSATPTSGPMSGGTAVTITGRNLDTVRKVRFGDAAAAISSQSENKLVVIAPEAASDFAVNIILEHPKGGVEAARFQYQR